MSKKGFGNDLWYTVQPKDKSAISWDLLSDYDDNKTKQMKSIPDKMQAKDIEKILRKKIAYLSGGKDKRNCYVLTIPSIKDPCPYTDKEFGITFKYLSGILSFLNSQTSFMAVLDGRTSTWGTIKLVIRKLQFYLPDEISLMCIVKPREFWEKHKTSHSFKKYRGQLGFRAVITSIDKLPQYVEKTQLTAEFGGWMRYDHNQWVNKRISYEGFHKEAQNVIELAGSARGGHSSQNQLRDGSTTSTSDYLSDSGHVSAGSPTTTSTSTAASYQHSRQQPADSTKHIYARLDDFQRGRPAHSRAQVRSPRSGGSARSRSTNRVTHSRTTTTTVMPGPSNLKAPSPLPRKPRSRSLSPSKYRAAIGRDQSRRNRYEAPIQQAPPPPLPKNHPPRNDYVYAVPQHRRKEKPKRANTNAKSASRGEIDTRMHDDSFHVNEMDSGGQKGQRHRHKSQDDVLTSPRMAVEPLDFSKLRMKPAKSEPNLTPRKGSRQNKKSRQVGHEGKRFEQADGCDGAISRIQQSMDDLPVSTRKRGEQLMENLRRSSDEFGFRGNSVLPQTDEDKQIMKSVSDLQGKLVNIQSSPSVSDAKMRRRNRSDGDPKRLRRRTVSGVPDHRGPQAQDLSRSTTAVEAGKKVIPPKYKKHARSASQGNLRLTEKPMSANEIDNALREMYNWIVGPGESTLQQQLEVGGCVEEAENLMKRHANFQRKAEGMTMISNLKLQYDKLKRTLESHQSNYDVHKGQPITEMLSEVKVNLDTVQETCKIFHGKVQRRSNLLERSLSFFKCQAEVSNYLVKLTEICMNEATLLDTTDGIHDLLGELHHCVQMTQRELQKFEISARIFSDLMKREQDSPYISSRCPVRVDYSKEIRFVHWSVNKMRENVKQSEEGCEASKNQFQHVLELKDSQRDASQTIEWICEMAGNIKTKHFALGVNAKETEILRMQHEEIKNTAKRAHDNGKKKLSCISVLRRTLDLSPGAPKSPSSSLKRSNSGSHLVASNGAPLPSLEDAWSKFMDVWEERNSRLAVAYLFHTNSEKIIKRASQLGSEFDLAFQSGPSSPASGKGSLPMSPTSPHITPLRDAHATLNDDMNHVMKVGNSILRDAGTKDERSDQVTSAIQAKMRHLDFLRSSLYSKWNRVERRKNIQSPGSTFMESMKEATDWIRIKLVECGPSTFDIGKNLKESVELRENHRAVLSELQAKEKQITSLLNKAKSYCEEDAFDRRNSSRNLYEAMAQSLSDLWQELKSHLNKRHHLLGKAIGFYESAEEFGKQLTYLEQYLKWKELPRDKSSAQSLLETHKEMRKNMLEASMQCLTHGQNLLEILKNWRKSQPDGYKASYGSACTAIECALESLIDRRRQVEHGYERRKEQLERSLITCHWESEVNEVIEWFEEAKKRNFRTKELGENLERAEAMLCHMDDIRNHAQTRLERAKTLLHRANESPDVLEGDPATTKASALDTVGEGFMQLLDERKDELAKAESFFRIAAEGKKSLQEIEKNLENMVFSTDLEELEVQCNKFMEAITLSYKPAEDLATEILQRRYSEEEDKMEPGAEGVEVAITELEERKTILENIVIKYRQEAMRINEMAGLFFASCQELTDWLTQQACDMLGRYTTLGGSHEETTEFLKWHKKLTEDLQKKNSDLESLVETANVLLEAGVARPASVRDRAEELKVDMTRINKIVNARTTLGENFREFLENTDEVSESMSRLRSELANSNHEKLNTMGERERTSLQEELQNVQEQCLNAIDSGQTLLSKLREGIEDDNIATEGSVGRVQEIMQRLKEEKDDLLDLWLTWQYRKNVGNDLNVQWKNVENTTDRLIKAMEKLESAVFINNEVRLGEDVDSTQTIIADLGDRLTLLQSIHGEIEKVVKLSEMLGLRSPPTRTPPSSASNTPRESTSSHQTQNSTDEKDQLIRSLLTRHANLLARLKNYSMALLTAKQVHRDTAQLWKMLRDTENDMQEKEILAATEGPLSHPKKESYVTLLLRNHDRLKGSVDELIKSITSGTFGVHQIINQLSLGRLYKPDDRPSIDKSTMEISAANTKWQKLWQEHRETLLNQLNTAWYSQELRKQKQQLEDVQRAVQTLENSLQSCTSKSIAESMHEEYEKLATKVRAPYEECTAFIVNAENSMGKSNPRQLDVDELKNNWSMTQQRIDRIRRLITAYEKYYEIAEKCDDWQFDINRAFSSIKQQVHSPGQQETKNLVENLERNVLKHFCEQEDRIDQMRMIFTEQIAHSSSVINTQRKSSRRHDFIQEAMSSLRVEALALKSRVEQQDQLRSQQEEYQNRQRQKWEQEKKQEPRNTLVQNVVNKVQESVRSETQFQKLGSHQQLQRQPPSQVPTPPPPPPPPPPPMPARTSPVTAKFTPKSSTTTPRSGMLKTSPNQHRLMEELAAENHTTASSTSGYSTLTDATKFHEKEPGANGRGPYDTTGYPGLSVKRIDDDRVRAMPDPPPIKQPLNLNPKPHFQSAKPYLKQAVTSGYAPSRMPLRPGAPSVNLNSSFQRAVSKQIKKYAGKPQASWESQIDQGISADEGKLFERPLAYAESAASEQSGATSQFTPVPGSFTSVTAEDTASETVSTLTSMSEEYVLDEETTASSDISTVESANGSDSDVPRSRINGHRFGSDPAKFRPLQRAPNMVAVKPLPVNKNNTQHLPNAATLEDHHPPSPPPRRHSMGAKYRQFSGSPRQSNANSPAQRVLNKVHYHPT